jgi:hypothetical protein
MAVDLTHARALTLKNPWAWAITNAGKRIENRGWPAPRGLQRVLVHAGAGWDRDAEGFIAGLGFELPALDTITTSAIVAVADLKGVCSATVDSPSSTCGCGPWAAPGQHHWRLARKITVLAEPVKCQGAQRTWSPPGHLMAAIAWQVS